MSRYRTIRIGGKSRKFHDVIWEVAHGCKIPPGYHIHHKDGDGRNNSLSNLVLMSRAEHAKLHANLRKRGKDVVDPNDPDVIKTRERSKRWNASHREYMKEYGAKYYRDNKDRIRIRSKQYHEENREAIRDQRAKHYAENRETILERAKMYRQTHLEQKRKADAEYRATHKEEIRAYKRERADLLRAQSKLRYNITHGASKEKIASLESKVEEERKRLKARGL